MSDSEEKVFASTQKSPAVKIEHPLMYIKGECPESNISIDSLSMDKKNAQHSQEQMEDSCENEGAAKSELVYYEENQEIEEYDISCRTCLNVTDEASRTVVSDICLLDKTFKDVIMFLVPEMEMNLMDDEVICYDCLKILETTMKFILKCVEVDGILTRQSEYMNCADDAEGAHMEEYIDQDPNNPPKQGGAEHNYCVKVISADGKLSDNYVEVSGLKEVNDSKIQIEYREMSSPLETVVEYVSDNVKDEDDSNDAAVDNEWSVGGLKGTVKAKDNDALSCSVCFEIFTSKQELKGHMDVHPPYVCEICGKVFRRKESLKGHKATHNDPNSFICEVCGKGFKDQPNLRCHLKMHESGESYMCEKCSKVFKNKRLLDLHIKYIHEKAYETQCTTCGIMCRTPASLQNHIKLVHVKEKPYECTICHKKFGRIDYLNNHIARHNEESEQSDKPRDENQPRVRRRTRMRMKLQDPGEPVPCKFCGQWYKDLISLKRHLETHLKRFPCQYCNLTFPRNILRMRHEEIHRGGAVNFVRCNVCWKKFKTKEALDDHVTCHNNPRHFCDICGKTFNRKFLLSQHKLVEHSTISNKEEPEEIIYDSLLEVGGERNNRYHQEKVQKRLPLTKSLILPTNVSLTKLASSKEVGRLEDSRKVPLKMLTWLAKRTSEEV